MNVEPESEFEVNDINIDSISPSEKTQVNNEYDPGMIPIMTVSYSIRPISYFIRPIGIVTSISFCFEFVMVIFLIGKLLSALTCKNKRKKDESFNRKIYC